MDLKPTPYTFTGEDEKRIYALGYNVSMGGWCTVGMFMKKYLPNFDLVSILEELERSFAPISKFPIKRVLRLIEQPPYLRIVYYNDYDADSNALVFDRAF